MSGPHSLRTANSSPRRSPAGALLLAALLLVLAGCSRVTLDCDQVRRVCREIHIGPTPTAVPAPPGAQIVPLRVVDGPVGGVVALVSVSISGQGPYSFALDTGASQSVVDLQIASQLGLPVVGRAPYVVGVTGGTEASLVRVDRWQMGDVSLPATRLVALDLPQTNRSIGLQGLLGSDMLSKFGAVTVDYANDQLLLQLGQ